MTRLVGPSAWDRAMGKAFLAATQPVLWNPTFTALTSVPGALSFTIAGTPGIPIRIQARTNLLHGAWAPVVSLTNLTALGSWQFQKSITPETPTRFYRIVGP